MNAIPPKSRLAGLVTVTSLLCCCAQFANAAVVNIVETAPPPGKESARLKIPLSADAESKLKDLTSKMKVETAKTWNLRMSKKIDQIATVTGLGEDGKHALASAARQAVDIYADSWSTKVSSEVRRVLSLQPALAGMILDQRMANIGAFAMADWVGDIDKPPDLEIWTKALHQTLTPEQAVAWEKAESDRKASVEKEAEVPLKGNRDRMHDQLTTQMLSASSDIESSAGLSREQSDKLETLARNVADESTDHWINRVEQVLLSMEDEQRHMFVKNGNFYIGMDEKESPLKQAAWKNGVAAILTVEENTRLETSREASEAKRVHALALLMITLLDDRVAFTQGQRSKLQPIAEKLVKDVPELYPENSPEGYAGFSPQMFYGASSRATDAELGSTLDETQIKHWRHAFEPEDTGGKLVLKSRPDEATEPDDVEKTISFFLYQKTERERQRLLDASGAKVEDVARVAGLGAETKARLELAIRGAAEQTLTTWKWFVEQQVRGQLQEVTPQNVKQRLEAIQDFVFQQRFFFGNRMGFQGGQSNAGIWEKTVDGALDARQKEAWKKETDARAAFRDQAIAEFSIAEFDRKNRLNAEQWTKLEPIISGIIHDSSADISQVFSSSNPWFMEGPYTLLPFAGVPEADLKGILTKAQWDQWHGSPECTNSANLWQNIQQMHKQRAGNK